MRFLVDAQLPPALAGWIRSQEGHEADHVAWIGMLDAEDRAIWRLAAERGYVLVTKDRDFEQLSVTDRTGPQLLWLRFGNAPKRRLIEQVEKVWPALLEALHEGKQIVEAW